MCRLTAKNCFLRIRTIPVLFLLVTGLSVKAQNSPDAGVPVNTKAIIVPTSPEAAALGKYVDIPVSLYTGLPQISIPIYTVKEGSITVPVSLSYQAGGFKADEKASRAGLGWVLNAGGVITRNIRGYGDDYPDGFLAMAGRTTPDKFRTGTAQERYDLYNNLTHYCHDAEPDEFFMNFNGVSAKFGFDWSQQIVYSSTSKLKITALRPGQDTIQGWDVITEDGMKYEFRAKEYNQVLNWLEVYSQEEWFTCARKDKQITSWFLSKIKSPTGDSVVFNYTPYTYTSDLFASEVDAYIEDEKRIEGYLKPPKKKITITKNKVYGQALVSITTSSGQTRIDFTATTARTDLGENGIGENYNRLDTVLIKDKLNVIVRKHAFAYDYSTGRLTLKSLTETGSDGTAKPSTRFVYLGGELPSQTKVFNKDHWGFLNTNTNTLLPPLCIETGLGMQYCTGADRSPNGELSKTALLSKIIYPTGGFQIFEYEPHDYNVLDDGSANAITRYEAVGTNALSGPPYTVRDTFTINNVQALFTIGYITSQCTDLPAGHLAPRVAIRNLQTGQELWHYQGSDAGSFTLNWLQPGVPYQISAYAELAADGCGDEAQIWVTWQESLSPTTGPQNIATIAGGARIKKIISQENDDDDNKIIRRFEYKMPNENGELISSGNLLNKISYASVTQLYIQSEINLDYKFINVVTNRSASRTQLGTTQGSHIGYGMVTVYNGESGEFGKTVTTFRTSFDYPDDVYDDLPYPPATSFDYQRGLIVNETEYKKSGGSYVEVSKTEYDYEAAELSIPAFKVGVVIGGIGPWGPEYLNRFSAVEYSLNLGFNRVTGQKKHFIANGERFSNEITSTYDSTKRFLTAQTQKVSAGKEIITQYYYPQNFPSSPVIDTLKSRHIFPTLEQITFEKGSDGIKRAIAGSYTQYNLFGTALMPLPAKNYRLITARPIENFNGINGGLALSSGLYGEVSSNVSYDPAGWKLLQVKAKEKENESYVWGYNKTLPVAKVENAAVIDVAFCDFEDDDKGGFTFDNTASNYINDPKTGKRAYKGSIITRSISNKTFIVSLWAKGSSVTVNGVNKTAGSAWMLLQWDIAGSSNVTILLNGSYIDGLRLHPAGSLMQTFTYDPLIGVTSISSPNNTITYYEYDGLGRLITVRDQNRNILKHHQYYYGR